MYERKIEMKEQEALAETLEVGWRLVIAFDIIFLHYYSLNLEVRFQVWCRKVTQDHIIEESSNDRSANGYRKWR